MAVVCITGMHRSGTSLLSRTLNLLGVHLGSEQRHLAANAGNPKGYWEHRGVLRINNAVLEAFGGSWCNVPHLPEGWAGDQRLAALRRKAAAVIDELSADASLIGFKDPRACLLLPFWREVTTIDHVVASTRAPHAVARSLQRRNGFSLTHGAALYTRYLSSLVVAAPDAYLVDYRDLLAARPEVLPELAAALGLPDPSPEIREQARAFAEPGLDHAPDEPSPSPELVLADEVHARLADLDGSRAWFTSLAWTLDRAADSRAPASEDAARAQDPRADAGRQAELDAVTARLDDATSELARERDRNRELREQLVASRERTVRIRADHDRLRARRSVRFALRLAGLAAPLVELIRRRRPNGRG